ncbi:MAG: alanine racemase [Actinomycetota bacterium]|nr:alanine racemase [Actinomycetota bacterium]
MASKKPEKDLSSPRDNFISLMNYPCLKIYPDKIYHNSRIIKSRCTEIGISVVGVTKCMAGDTRIADVMKRSGIDILGDSRLENLERLRNFYGKKQELMMLRSPMLDEVGRMVEVCDISLNTQLKTVKLIEEICIEKNIKHRIIVMVETDDKREGLNPGEVVNFCELVAQNCKSVELYGLGTNAGCIIKNNGPDPESLKILIELGREVTMATGIRLPVISGGNSSIWNLIEKNMVPEGVNQVRIGEAILLGHDTVDYKPIKEAFTDTFILEAQVIEVKKRNDMVYKIILALGLQDVRSENIYPCNPGLYIISQSSDHTVMGLSKIGLEKAGLCTGGNSLLRLEPGSVISFKLDYFGVLSCMTSPFVKKKYIEGYNSC